MMNLEGSDKESFLGIEQGKRVTHPITGLLDWEGQDRSKVWFIERDNGTRFYLLEGDALEEVKDGTQD